jgi:hypothetical protein
VSKQTDCDPVGPGGWPSDLPPRSILFGLTPYGFDGATRENIVSFFRRTSDAHGVLPRALAHHVVVPMMHISSKSLADLRADECYRLQACGLSTRAERWIDVLNQLTSRSDLQLLTLLPLKNLVSSYHLIESANRFCPACYAADERAGRAKYDRLLWTLCCVTSCPKHGRQLIFEPRGKGRSPLPFTVPGISRIDGSSLARLSSKKASKYEVEIARLVAELLEDISRIGAQKTSLLSAFLTHGADVLFDGNAAALARHLGLSKSQVHGWMHQGILASLSGVARIAYSFECTMADVLLGNKAKLRLRQGRKLPRGLFRFSRRVGHKTPHGKLLASLSKFMKKHPDACAQDAANHLEVSAKFLRKNFPMQNVALVEAGRLHKQQMAQARQDAKDDAYKKSHFALADNGVYPSRRKVMKRLKEMGIRLSFAETKRAKDRAHAASRIGKRGPRSVNANRESPDIPVNLSNNN